MRASRSFIGRRAPILILLAWIVAFPISAAKRPYVEGDRLTFAFEDLDGNVVESSDPRFAGRVLLVDLWGTWCPPCVSEIPTLVDLQRQFADQGLMVVAIAFEDEGEDPTRRRERLRTYVEQQKINYLVLDGRAPKTESEEIMPELKNVRGFPVEVLIGRDGKPVDARNGYGYSKRWAKRLERELLELLAEPIPTQE